MAYKAKAQVDGKEVEVELTSLPEGVIPQDQFDIRFRQELDRRSEALKTHWRGELLGDETFKTEALQKWNVKPSKDGKTPQLTEEQLTQLRSSWEQEHVAPLKSELQSASAERDRLRDVQLRSALIGAAAQIGVKKAFLTPPEPESDPPIVAMLRHLFGYDPKTKSWAVKNGEGFVFSANATEKRPYKTPEEFVMEWGQRKENADLLDSQTQRGASVGDQPRRSGGVVQLSRADARNSVKFRAAEAEAAKINGTVEIVD